MLSRILIGLVVSLIGFILVWKTEFIMGIAGYVDWAERWLGGGGTRLFYKLLGTATIIIGFLVVTNLFNAFASSVIGGIFGSGR